MVLIKLPESAPLDPEDEDIYGVMSESEPDDDIDDPDWEEVKAKDEEDEDDELDFKKLPILPSEGVDIVIQDNRSKKDKKKSKREVDLNEIVRKHVNRKRIALQLDKHKLSLLLFVARGLRLLKIARCDIIRGLALSLVDDWFSTHQQPLEDSIPADTKEKAKKKSTTVNNKRRVSARSTTKKLCAEDEESDKPKNKNVIIERSMNERDFILDFLEWFSRRIAICDDDDVRATHLKNAFMVNLLNCFNNMHVTSLIELVIIFSACLKAIKPKLPIRILNILRPITMKADIIPKHANTQDIVEQNNNDSIFAEQSTSSEEPLKKSNHLLADPTIEEASSHLITDGKRKLDIDFLIVSNLDMAPEPNKKLKKSTTCEDLKPEIEIEVLESKVTKRRTSRVTKVKTYQDNSDAEDDDEPKTKRVNKTTQSKTNSKKKNKDKNDNDLHDATSTKTAPKIQNKNSEVVKSTKKKATKEPDIDIAEPSGVPEKLDFWLEVFSESEKKWICVDVCNNKIDEPEVLNELNKPFYYLLSFDIDRNCIKPAEQYYCPDWYAPAFKRERCDPKWWQLVLDAYGPSKQNEKDGADKVKSQLLLTNQDLPKSDNAFRNHPLYVLQKHLLKYQVIYPPDIAPVGFFKDEPIYPRDSVHTCRSRETWLRQAKTVKLGEQPYKIVKARPKKDKYTGELQRDLPLEIFGEWQTEAYVPPTATDGKVPRNIYGNVDMYQSCMLPKGCVHLKLPGLQRIANKLQIDCAAAVIGFDNHCGSYGSHPVLDGFIVCEEYEETLQAAWEEEQINAKKREEDKRSKRIWDNWKRLLKAAIIREKLRVKYKD